MKKKLLIVLIFLGVVTVGVLIAGRLMPEAVEDMLTCRGAGSEETIVDVAIQEGDHLLYIRKIRLIQDDPVLADIIRAINESDEGIFIEVDAHGSIYKIYSYVNNEKTWQVYIENRRVEETDAGVIPVENYQGITLLYH